MTDRILEGWLARNQDEGLALAADSDRLALVPIGPAPAQRYLAEYRCTGLVRTPAGAIVEAGHFVVGVWFPDDYLRRVEPFQVLTWLEPRHAWHPNIGNQVPFICIGRIVPATPLVDLLYRCHEVITYNRLTMVEGETLNREACAWARANVARFPIDRRPLKRRGADFDVCDVDLRALEGGA